MDSDDALTQNYIGLLHEKCIGANLKPQFIDDPEVRLDKTFKYICTLNEWTTEGIGVNKKIAKQKSAQNMLKKIESENLIGSLDTENKCKTISNESAISKLYEYCKREDKKENPLFSDRPNESGLFVVSCTLNNFTAEGKGSSKKIAKENAAELCAKKFGIDQYFDDLKKTKERQNCIKNSSQLLHELCQLKKLNCAFQNETNYVGSKKEVYVCICTVGSFETRGNSHVSKKLAKLDASSQMLSLLKNETPVASPSNEVNDNEDNEPLAKRIKL